jgi:hypothetical protein
MFTAVKLFKNWLHKFILIINDRFAIGMTPTGRIANVMGAEEI